MSELDAITLPNELTDSGAVLSDDEVYRYALWRVWDRNLPTVALIMLNPSTADASIDDPTIRSCRRLTSEHGFGGFIVVNLFAYRATKPNELLAASQPIGPRNQDAVIAALGRSRGAICAWGAHKAAKRRIRSMKETIKALHHMPKCFGMTKGGAPKHPLYIKSGTPLETYP